MDTTHNDSTAIQGLVGRGARFVLLKLPGKHTSRCDRRADCACWKTPARTGYHLRRSPSVAAVLSWQGKGGNLGVLPSSLNSVVLDIDHGDPAPLLEACLWLPEYVTDYKTRRGAHLWLGRDRAVSSPKWEGYGASGDVLDGRRYAVLHGAADDELGEAFAGRPRRTLRRQDPFKGLQLDLFKSLLSPRPPQGDGPPSGTPLQAVGEHKGRNVTLRDHTRRAARPVVDVAATWQEALDFTRQVAHDANDRFPVPLAAAEVEAVALSCARYLWRNKGFAAPHNQARRGRKSGRVRLDATRDRDANIRRDYAQGLAKTEIAARHGVSEGAVRNVLKRTQQTVIGG